MTKPVFIILCTISVIVQCTAQLTCGPGEVVDECPSNCDTDRCPTKEHQYRDCSNKECGTPRCKCPFNMKRGPNGICIDITKCPPFKCDRPFEEYVPCAPLCPTDDCNQSTPDGRCQMFGTLLIELECSPTCRCIKDYWRHNGTCVPYLQCPEHATSFPIFFGK